MGVGKQIKKKKKNQSQHCHHKHKQSQLKKKKKKKSAWDSQGLQQNHTTDSCRNRGLCQEHKENIQPTLAESVYPSTMPFNIFHGSKKPSAFIVLGRDLHVLVGVDEEPA